MRRLASIALLILALSAHAEAPTDALSLLEQHCVRCHGGEKTKGGLDLTTREALLKGGESGLVLSSDKPNESVLLKSIRHESDSEMPYKEPKLSDAAIKTIEQWVRDGALYSRKLKAPAQTAAHEFKITEVDQKHWAFQPISRLAVPQVSGSGANPIDAFLLAKLKESNLTFSEPAARELLLRRVTFDLIGLPPTPAEIEAFLRDTSKDAYEKVIDRLLASPHYGERWGRHWLDLARFAESDGFEHDAVRPHSWRYRDYVVRAFNSDKPYDRFIREQLAGDELFPDDPEAITATAFNLLGPDMVDSSDQVQRRHNTLNDMTDTASLAFMGLTLGCARCHDHKFEPLSQKDYYSLQAFFAPAKFEPARPIPTDAQRRAHAEAMRKYNAQPEVRELADMEAAPREKVFKRKVAALSSEAQVAHNTPADQRNAEQANLVLETQDKVNITDQDIAAELDADQKARRKKLADAIKKLPRPAPLPMSMALANRDLPPKARVLFRGEYSQPGDEVPATIPVVLSKTSAPKITPKHPRAALADWLVAPENPLTARVMVNRIWQHHFGRGLVASPSNFGTQGQRPTHPELLDWLASEFVGRGWSIKQMHKLMLTSRAYQQTTFATSGAMLDPENKLYWRMNRLRLEGEAIRDALLAIGGQLQPQLGGPGVYPPLPKELFQGATGWPTAAHDPKHDRRSIYIFARRNLRFPFLEVFDMPDNNLSCPTRERSATAPQSLTLLNSDEVLRASKAAAKSVANIDRDQQIKLVYLKILNRPVTSDELEIAKQFLAQSPLEEFCRALFNLNDFVYVN